MLLDQAHVVVVVFVAGVEEQGRFRRLVVREGRSSEVGAPSGSGRRPMSLRTGDERAPEGCAMSWEHARQATVLRLTSIGGRAAWIGRRSVGLLATQCQHQQQQICTSYLREPKRNSLTYTVSVC